MISTVDISITGTAMTSSTAFSVLRLPKFLFLRCYRDVGEVDTIVVPD